MRTAPIAACLMVCLLASLPASAQATSLVTYERVGGLRGEQVRLQVGGAGRATLTENRRDATRFRLSGAELKSLRRDLRAARLQDCRSRYAPSFPIADGISETVRAGGERVAVETEGDPPRRLERLLGRLQRIVERH